MVDYKKSRKMDIWETKNLEKQRCSRVYHSEKNCNIPEQRTIGKRLEKNPERMIPNETFVRYTIKDWNADCIPMALLHPASSGHDLNIRQVGHILIWFGLTCSLELYQQTKK